MSKFKIEGYDAGVEVVITPNPSNKRKPRVYTTQEWEILENIIMNADNKNQATRSYQRLVIGHAIGCVVDENGCVDLPEVFSLYAENES